MSRSFNDGTPNWAKVRTRPEPRRFNSRTVVSSALAEMEEAFHAEFVEAVRNEFHEAYDRFYDEDPAYADDWAERHRDLFLVEPDMDDFYVLDDYLPGDL